MTQRLQRGDERVSTVTDQPAPRDPASAVRADPSQNASGMIPAPRICTARGDAGAADRIAAGANSTCSVMNGMASASTSTICAAGIHFAQHHVQGRLGHAASPR